MVARAAQLPLIHVVDSDDLDLERCEDLLWFRLLRNLDWPSLRPVAARYYEALWQFNVEQQRERARRQSEAATPNPETRQQATLRLVQERPTVCDGAVPLYEVCEDLAGEIDVDPEKLEPGCVPLRIAGRQPKCFFALLRAFLGMTLRGRAAEPDVVYDELRSNPSYARACGFTPPVARGGYRQSDIPSRRKLEQFDQIMINAGLWHYLAVEEVRRNWRAGAVAIGNTMVHDTTHYPARSAMRAVELPAEARAPSVDHEQVPKPKGTSAKKKSGGKSRKSQPRTVKRCRCADRSSCPHPWVSADPGAGTVTKSGHKQYWAHKASTLGIPGAPEVLLDAVAMNDAAAHDSNSLEAHIERLFELLPEIEGKIEFVLDDGAADDQELKWRLNQRWGIILMAPINPRRRKKQTKDLPRGIGHIEPSGVPVCRQGFPLDFVGVRHEDQRFIFRAPDDANGVAVCKECPVRPECYRGQHGARQVTIPFDRLPWINPGLPQLSLRFQRQMAQRTVIERLHKLMKEDYGDERLSKRGNDAFQARLDKTRLAMHLVIADRHRH